MADTAPNTHAAGTISAAEAARLLMLESERRIQQLAADGYIERAGHGRYLTVSVVQGYIRFLKEGKERLATGTSENRIREARAREVELRNSKSENELIDLSEATAVLDDIVGMLRSEFIGYPAAMTRDLTMRKKLEAGVNDIFTRATDRVLETVAALAASGEVVEADPEDES